MFLIMKEHVTHNDPLQQCGSLICFKKNKKFRTTMAKRNKLHQATTTIRKSIILAAFSYDALRWTCADYIRFSKLLFQLATRTHVRGLTKAHKPTVDRD